MKASLHVLPQYIYSYRPLDLTKNDCQEIDALRHNYIWFSNLLEKNDPMEGSFIGSSSNLVQKIVDNKISIYFSSMSQYPNIVPMWAHYSRGHQGICIQFNLEKLVNSFIEENKNEFYEFTPVIYSNKITNLTQERIIGRGEDSCAKETLSLKKEAWAYEKEWRIFSTMKGKNYYDDECISNIYFGNKARSEFFSNFNHSTKGKYSKRIAKVDFVDGQVKPVKIKL